MKTSSENIARDLSAFILEDNLKPYRDFILQNSKPPVTYSKGTVLSSGGYPSAWSCFLLDGLVKVSIFNTFGYERILSYHKKNSLFVMDGLRKDKSVIVTTTALTPVSVIKLSTEEVAVLVEKNPRFAVDLILYYSDVLKFMCYDAESQSSHSVQSKLANFILLYMQSEDYHVLGHLPFSQSELASTIDASHIQVARICASLKKEGLIDLKKRKLYVLDQQRLQNLASFKRV